MIASIKAWLIQLAYAWINKKIMRLENKLDKAKTKLKKHTEVKIDDYYQEK